jgi:hypothetical protein
MRGVHNWLWGFITLILLAGCAHHLPPATLPVAVSCVPKETPKAPQIHTPEQLRLAPDDASFVTMTSADYLALYAWMLKASPVLEGCRAAAE